MSAIVGLDDAGVSGSHVISEGHSLRSFEPAALQGSKPGGWGNVTIMRIFSVKASVRSSLVVCLLGASTVYADSFSVTTNGPGVTAPTRFDDKWASSYVETFDALNAGRTKRQRD